MRPSGAPAPYTVLGGRRWDRVRKYAFPLTLLILSRGDRLFRSGLLRELESLDMGEIVWVEGSDPSPDVESLSRDFPEVRFLLISSPTTAGERINIGISESRSPLVLCAWSDMRLLSIPRSMPGVMEKSGAACTVPFMKNARLEPIPSRQSPVWKKRRIALAYRIPRNEGEPTLFPFDYCGVYNREKFAQTGGFDPAIENPYWQKLDFGFRCFLWGERICGTTRISLSYTSSPPAEDATPDRGYKLFYLKNMAVRFKREMGMLPSRRVWDYMIHSDTSPFYAIREFREAKAWVRAHRFRFRRDPRDLIERWESL